MSRTETEDAERLCLCCLKRTRNEHGHVLTGIGLRFAFDGFQWAHSFSFRKQTKKKCKWLKKKVGCYRLSLEWFGVLVFILGDKVISHPVFRKGDLVCRRVK